MDTSYASPNVFFSCGTTTIFHTKRQNSDSESNTPHNNLRATGSVGSVMHSAAAISSCGRYSPSSRRVVHAGAGDPGCGSTTPSRLTWQIGILSYQHAVKTTSGDYCRRRLPTAPTGRRSSSGDAQMDVTFSIILYDLVI